MMAEMRMARAMKMDPPTFKGTPGENPEPHILSAHDWLELSNIPPHQRVDKFKLTLAGKARQWFDEIPVPINWDALIAVFRTRFSVLGRSNQMLHDRWASFKFDPTQDDIDVFLEQIK